MQQVLGSEICPAQEQGPDLVHPWQLDRKKVKRMELFEPLWLTVSGAEGPNADMINGEYWRQERATYRWGPVWRQGQQPVGSTMLDS